jgi:hypothetical protein
VQAAVEHHLQPLRVEPDNKILSMRNYRHANPAGECPPFPELEDVFGDVGLLELTTVFSQPILGESTVGSGRRGVDLNIRHDNVLACELES